MVVIVTVQSNEDDYNYDDSTEDTLTYVDYNDSQSSTDCLYHESTYQDNEYFYRGINDCSICLCRNRNVSCDDLGCQEFLKIQSNAFNDLDFLESVEYNYEQEQEVVNKEINLFHEFPGPYCAARYPQSTNGTCCDDRMDSCSVPISSKIRLI